MPSLLVTSIKLAGIGFLLMDFDTGQPSTLSMIAFFLAGLFYFSPDMIIWGGILSLLFRWIRKTQSSGKDSGRSMMIL